MPRRNTVSEAAQAGGKKKGDHGVGRFHKMVSYLLNSRKSFELGLLISLGTGTRVGELCGMRWEDI